MTTVHCSVFSFHASSSITRRKPLIIVSSKTARRKNYLRPKILKTLTKSSPIIPPTLPQSQPILSPHQEHEFCVDVPADDTQFEDIIGAVRETRELEELQVSVDTAKDNGIFGNVSAKDIFKYGAMYIIGAFVYQTVCYFWNLRNQHSNGDLDVIGKEKRNILFGENWKTGEDQIVEKKIEEIKLMAREARRIELEKKGKEKEDEDLEIDDDESVVSSAKLGIEKEIVERLLKLKNRINSKKDGSSAMRLNGRGNSAG
ncbi:myb-like protein X-like, partial [Trifolium medium]|nr:myb-like protein X-like [Trifolium medium]